MLYITIVFKFRILKWILLAPIPRISNLQLSTSTRQPSRLEKELGGPAAALAAPAQVEAAKQTLRCRTRSMAQCEASKTQVKTMKPIPRP